MSLYSHLTDEELFARRTLYMQSLEQRLTGPSRVSSGNSTVGFNDRAVEYQQVIKDLRLELGRIANELQARGLTPTTGTARPRQPIYLVGR
jgi:hypothetical protein